MSQHNDFTAAETPQRFPNLSKMGIAIIEYLVGKVVGESVIDEIKKPYAEKETVESLSKAIARVEEQFINQYPNERARQALMQLPVHDLPVVQNELWNFYKHPNDKGLENALVSCLVGLRVFDNEEIKNVIYAYLNILRREFVNINSELREKIQAIALLEIAETVKQVKDILGKQENQKGLMELNGSKEFHTAQLILNGDFDTFDETKLGEIVAVLSILLRIEGKNVKILRVMPGSIIIEIELESASMNELVLLVEKRESRLLKLGVVGLKLSNGDFVSTESISQSRSLSIEEPLQQTPTPIFGIITALPKEYAAVKAVLKKTKIYRAQGRGAGHRYLLGEIPAKNGGKHSIVLSLADMGNNIASLRATQLLEHFPSVESVIMVGIAGGVPYPDKPAEHVRLGDIVVSDRQGVVQYDLTKETQRETIHRHPPRPPSAVLWEGVQYLVASEINGSRPWLNIIDQSLRKQNIARPSDETDILASSVNPELIAPHPKDPKRVAGQPRVFLGPIASANVLLKDPQKRDQLRAEFGIKAVEMEGSGIADATWNFEKGYLVIRGICDYCDSNKGDEWQQYAAIVAASYCFSLIASIPAEVPSQITLALQPKQHIGQIAKPVQREKWIGGRYRIVELIGKGRFGVVHKAFDKNINAFVAVKEIQLVGNTKEERGQFSERFKREANTLSRLVHPNIAGIQNFGETRRSLYLVTTYFPGGTLESRLGPPILFNKAAGLLVPIGKALAYAHKMGFIHRDVKPSNILFTDTGEPILSDFGLVKSLRTEDPILTSDLDAFIGTPAYAAPEQWEGRTVFPSDIYSLGVVFYEMVTGRNPLSSKNLAERLIEQYLDKPSSIVRELPKEVDEVILRATATKLTDRYGSMDEFLVDLRKLAIEKIPAPTLPPMPRAVEHEESIALDVTTAVQADKQGDEKLALLLDKFEQHINELISQKDFFNARRLLKVVERFGVEGQKVVQKFQNQLPP